MITPPVREAARALIVDADQRVLLLRYDENGGFWATPGGRVEDGEDDATAVRRELREELGAGTIDLGAQIAVRSHDHPVGGQPVRQIEKYFLVRAASSDIDPARATNPDNIRARRWWTLHELWTTTETVYPIDLADLLTTVLTEGPPARPIALT